MNQRHKLCRLSRKSRLYLKRSSPVILCCMAAIGVVGTAVASAKATPKAVKLLGEATDEKGEELSPTEMIVMATPLYVPAIAIGAGTIVCIFGANALNRHQQAVIMSAYTLVSNAYQDYRNKVRELYGEETDQKIVDAITLDNCRDVYIYDRGGICGGSSLSVEEDPEAVRLFYDCYSRRYFESTLAKVIQAEYHLNRNYTIAGFSSVDEYYGFLGLDSVDKGDILGWDMGSGIAWIDFNHREVELETGLECCVIEMVFEPWIEGD